METKQYIAYQDEKGNPVYKEVMEEELRVLTNTTNWHDDTRGIRLVLTEEVKARLIMLSRENDILGTQPEAAGLLDYIRTIQAPTHVEGTTTYIYLEELYPEHETVLVKYGVIIERK